MLLQEVGVLEGQRFEVLHNVDRNQHLHWMIRRRWKRKRRNGGAKGSPILHIMGFLIAATSLLTSQVPATYIAAAGGLARGIVLIYKIDI